MAFERPPGDVLPRPQGRRGSGWRREYDDEFDDFFRTQYPRVVKSVMYAGATFEDAEDAALQAMAQAYICWPLLTHPAAWVRVVALRLYVKQVMKDRRRGDGETAAARRDWPDRGSANTHEEPEEHRRAIAVLRCLPAAQRVAMALTFDGYTPAEIAELLHQKPVTVRSNLRHARMRLRHELQNPAADGKVAGNDKEEA